MTELNFIQKVILSERNNHPDPIFINNNPVFEVKRDERFEDPNMIEEAKKPLCAGQYDGDSSFCKECQDAEGCEAYKEDLEDQKEKASHSSFEVRK